MERTRRKRRKNHRLPLSTMKTKQIPLMNFFAETLRETLEDFGLPQEVVARATGIPKQHLSEMKLGKRRCTAENALRLAAYYDTSPAYWLTLQLNYELAKAQQEKGQTVLNEVSPVKELNNA